MITLAACLACASAVAALSILTVHDHEHRATDRRATDWDTHVDDALKAARQ